MTILPLDGQTKRDGGTNATESEWPKRPPPEQAVQLRNITTNVFLALLAGVCPASNVAFAADCDCSRVVDKCTATVRADSQWVYLSSTSNSCSDIRYHIKTSTSKNDFSYPQQATIVGGSSQDAWTGQGKITAISVDSCSVCRDESKSVRRPIVSSKQTCSAFKASILQGLDSATLSSPEAMSFIDKQVEKKRVDGDCQ